MVIGEIERNPTEVVRVSVSEYKGRKYVDLRIYYKDDEGEWKPTKKGVTVQPDKVEQMLALGFQASPPGSHRLADDLWSFTRRGDFCLLWLTEAATGQDQYTLILNCFQPISY